MDDALLAPALIIVSDIGIVLFNDDFQLYKFLVGIDVEGVHRGHIVGVVGLLDVPLGELDALGEPGLLSSLRFHHVR